MGRALPRELRCGDRFGVCGGNPRGRAGGEVIGPVEHTADYVQVNVRDHGIQVCRMLKADPDTRGLAAGANEYLTKPFSPLALLRMVESLREAV